MVTLRRDELEQLTPEERKLHFEAEAKNVFGHDAKKDRHGRYIEQGRGSPQQPTVQSMGALLAAEGMDAYNRAIEAATKAGVWPPPQMTDEAAFQKAQAAAAKLTPYLPNKQRSDVI
jgi:hypothetical protein